MSTYNQRLIVYWDSQIVGFYDKDNNNHEVFTYAPEYLASKESRPISHSLPLSNKSYTRKQLRPFFAGLLPEESQRQRIASYLGLAESDDYSMLAAIGGECAGALTILPNGIKPEQYKDSITYCDEDHLYEILKSLPYRPMLVGESGLRLSLAGAQSKLPIIYREGKFYLPENGTPSTHIIKPELTQWFQGIVYNEHCCMTLARSLKLNVAETKILKIKDIPCLVVSRYDRQIDKKTGVICRIHQEDFCQALGRQPEQKYQSEGGPIIREVVHLIRDGWSTTPAKDILSFVDLIIYNAIIGNADAHAKNYSMLYKGMTRQLAPGYDLVSTVCWPALESTPAMKIGGSESINSILSGHWKKFANEINLNATALSSRVKTLCEAIINAKADEISLPPECDKVLTIIKARANNLVKQIR